MKTLMRSDRRATSEAAILRDLRARARLGRGPESGGVRVVVATGAPAPYQSCEELLVAGAATASARRRSSRRAEEAWPRAGRRAMRDVPRLSREQAAERIAAGERPAIRFRVPGIATSSSPTSSAASALPYRRHRRPDHPPRRRHPAYNFAVVVDDALMDVTHVVRGGSHFEHAAAAAPLRGARLRAAGVRPPGAGDGAGPQSARSATALPRCPSSGEGFAGSARQLLALIAVASGRGNNDELCRRTSSPAVRARGRRAQPACSTRRSSPGQPPLPEAGGSDAPGRARCGISTRRACR
jgi:hypothetical protein